MHLKLAMIAALVTPAAFAETIDLDGLSFPLPTVSVDVGGATILAQPMPEPFQETLRLPLSLSGEQLVCASVVDSFGADIGPCASTLEIDFGSPVDAFSGVAEILYEGPYLREEALVKAFADDGGFLGSAAISFDTTAPVAFALSDLGGATSIVFSPIAGFGFIGFSDFSYEPYSKPTDPEVPPVPLPAGLPLLGGALGLMLLRRR